jgi:hypothetical protein
VTASGLDRELVDAFVDGRLDPAAQARLADQVARLLPLQATAPNPVWTGTRGMPRLVARCMR